MHGQQNIKFCIWLLY